MPSVARAADRGSLGDPTGRRGPRCLKTGSTGWAQSADREISEDDSAAGWISRSYHPRRPRRGGRRRDANRGGGLTGTDL